MNRKISRKISFILAALCTFLTAFPASAKSETISSNSIGKHDGFDYELWMDEGNAKMILNEGGAFECVWDKNQTGNVLFRTGKKLDKTKTYDEIGTISLNYGCDYQPDGSSYLCLYGWSVDPLIEFYVVESWGSWRPPGASSKGTIKMDDGTYNIYETTRVEQPSIEGNKTFQQYWSVRTDKKTSGTISVSEHFKAWEKLGMKLGNLYEISFCVEGYQSSGTANVYSNMLTFGDTTIGSVSSPPDAAEANKTSEANGINGSSDADSDSGNKNYIFIVLGILVVGGGVLLFTRKKRKNKN